MMSELVGIHLKVSRHYVAIIELGHNVQVNVQVQKCSN